MGKKNALKSVCLYGRVYGEGLTQKDAREEAEAKIGRIVQSAAEGPRIYEFKGQIAVMWYGPNGWTYTPCVDHRLETASRAERAAGAVLGSFQIAHFDDEEDCAARLRAHMAQNAWSYEWTHQEEVEATAFVSGEQGTGRMTEQGYRIALDLASWMEWQRLYREWKNAGASDTLARNGADSRTAPSDADRALLAAHKEVAA